MKFQKHLERPLLGCDAPLFLIGPPSFLDVPSLFVGLLLVGPALVVHPLEHQEPNSSNVYYGSQSSIFLRSKL